MHNLLKSIKNFGYSTEQFSNPSGDIHSFIVVKTEFLDSVNDFLEIIIYKKDGRIIITEDFQCVSNIELKRDSSFTESDLTELNVDKRIMFSKNDGIYIHSDKEDLKKDLTFFINSIENISELTKGV